MNDSPLVRSLKELCLFLDGEGMRYALVGGLAVGIWAAPRATVDIDFLVAVKSAEFGALVERLRKSGRFLFIHERPMTFQRVSLLRATLKSNPDITVDFLFADDEFKQEALNRSSAVSLGDYSVTIPSPEDLILLKLLSGRPLDRIDAENVIETQKGLLDREYIKRWAVKLGLSGIKL